MNITTVKELVKPIGRPGVAIDFPVETTRFDPEELKPLIGKEVYVQSKKGQFSFANGEEHNLKITDISATKIYGTLRNRTGIVDVDLNNLDLLEWNEVVVKRIARRSEHE